MYQFSVKVLDPVITQNLQLKITVSTMTWTDRERERERVREREREKDDRRKGGMEMGEGMSGSP